MSRWFGSLFLVFAVAACSLTHGQGVAPNPSIAEMSTNTVALVQTDVTGDSQVFCSGVWVSPTRILTANHCVESLAEHVEEVNPSKVRVHYVLQDEVAGYHQEPYSVHTARVALRDPVLDLALLEALGPVRSHTWAFLGKEPPQGTHLRIIGHQFGLYWSLIEGNVSAYRVNFDGPGQTLTNLMQVSAPVYFGNSGGGAFNDHGELVGIASFVMRGPNLAFFVAADVIKDFLSEAK